MDELKQVIIGFAVVSAIYQIYSLFDFFNGGSYVYQQGVKRMVGVWTSGIGAANYYGFLALYTIPFGYFWREVSETKTNKVLSSLVLALCIISVLLSGTRGAVVTLLVPLIVYGWKLKNKMKIAVIFCISLLLIMALLPDSMKTRYTAQLFSSKAISDDKYDVVAAESAQSRLEGLEDGFALFFKRPILGYGPSTSSVARHEVREELGNADLQLHNLYGQLVAELGFLGTLMFIVLLVKYFKKIKNPLTGEKYSSDNNVYKINMTCRTGMLILLVYGFFGHILYGYYFMLLFALNGAVQNASSSYDEAI